MADKVQVKIPEPVVGARSWVYDYARPKGARWPVLAMTDLPGRDGEVVRKGTPIAPDRIRVCIRLSGGRLYVAHVSAAGRWARTRVAISGWKRLLHDVPPGQMLQIYAPPWVLELAADALTRACREVDGDA